MTQAFWQAPAIAVGSGSRLVGMQDATASKALLRAFRDSTLAMEPNLVAASMSSASEEIRTDSVWYLVHGYSPDASKLPATIRAAVQAPKEEPSVRESFGRELLRRMAGNAAASDARWTAWLQTAEADELIGSESSLFEYFTDDEFTVRKRYCDIASSDCRVPTDRKATYASTAVAQPDFELPAALPPGLADAVVQAHRCNSGWLAVASATSDRAGRVQKTTIERLATDARCLNAADELMKLSFATPASLVASLEAHNILLVQPARSTTCLDEASLEEGESGLRRIGGDVKAPIVRRRVEPTFPVSVRRTMGPGSDVFVVIECVITKSGCVRSIHLISQSPFPSLNGAALEAVAQWKFLPAHIGKTAVDSIFNLTVHYKMTR